MGEMIKPSQRAARRVRKQSWLLKYVQENPIKVGVAVVLGIGGVLILIFFAQLKIMPDIDLASSTAVLAAVALVGLLVFGFVSFTAVIPGVGTRHIAEEAEITLDKFTVISMFVPALTLIGLIIIQAYELSSWLASWEANHLLGFTASLALLLSAVAIRRTKLTASSTPAYRPGKVELPKALKALGLWFAMMLWILGIFFTFYLYLMFAQHSGRGELETLFYALLWIAFATMTNVALAMFKSSESLRATLIIAPLSCYLLLIFSGNFSVISVTAIKALGFGEVGPTRIVLSASACKALNQSVGGKAKCQIKPDQGSGYICPVNIKSRIGSQVLIDLGKSDKTGLIVVNKADILVWSVFNDEEAKKPTSRNDEAKRTSEDRKNQRKAEREMRIADFCGAET
jgi:MFS family permease